MNNQFGRFKVWDTLEKKILDLDVALTNYNNMTSLKKLGKDNNGVYLHAIGRRDRYIILPLLPRTDKSGQKLWVGDLLSNGTGNMMVIRYDLMKGVYCSLISMQDSYYNSLDILLEEGLLKVGDIFDGVTQHEGEHHKATMIIDPELFL